MEDPELAIQGGIIEQQGLSKFCKLCQEAFTVNIQTHICKDSHRNILYWEAVNNPAASQYLLSSLPEVVLSAKLNDDIQALDRDRVSYACKVCSGKKPFFGLQPLKDHLNGKDHNKAKRLVQMASAMKINSTSGSISSVQKAIVPDSTTASLPLDVQKLLQDKIVEIIENNGLKSFKCIICNNQSTGVEPLRQHILGKPHKKKVAQNPYNTYMVSDSRELSQPTGDMEWSTTDSSQDQTHGQNQPNPDIQNIIYPISALLNDSNTYKNMSLPRGLVYIFNNTFSGKDERKGSRQDSINLTLLFKSMGYKVKVCPNMSKHAVFQKLTEIQNEPELRSVDCLIIIIMSHGDPKDDRRFLASDMEPIELDEVRYRFTTTRCPALSGKPKIFLSNFCRGGITEILMPVADLESDAPTNYTDKEAPRDMCTIHASISGFEARRHPEKGTVFALSLCSVLSKYSHNTEMADLYRELCRDMIKRVSTTPEQQNYFFLRFYFNPTKDFVTCTT